MAEEHTEIIEAIDKEPVEGLKVAAPGEAMAELETEVTGPTKKRWRTAPALLGTSVLFAVTVIALVLSLANVPEITSIDDADVPLSSGLSDTDTMSSTQSTTLPKSDEPIGGSMNAVSENGIAGQEDNTESGSGGSSSSGSGTTNSNGGVNSGSNGSNGGGNTGQTWHPSWTEQVWVDTSIWQSVYVGENPIYEYHSVCNECGAIISGFAAQHLLDTGHGSYSNNVPILIGYTPVYETRWVESGYWETITHPGYWG